MRASWATSAKISNTAQQRDLSRNNSRIHYLEQMIKTAIIVSTGSKSADTVGLFDKVRLYIEEDEEEMEIVLVTTLRQDSLNNFISKESPLGKAVMGKKVGDRVLIEVNPSYSYYVVIRNIEKGKDDESLNISAF